jgi:stearoyl-CoA desaturase (delta-9 desaturase)
MSIPVPIVVALLAHWWTSVFFQSFFLHRYAAHRMFYLSPFWQRAFHLITYVAQGASYLTPSAYAVLHRMHHAYSDQPGDPHSPRLESNPMKMMLNTLRDYRAVQEERHPLAAPFTHDLVRWPALDGFGRTTWSSLLWIALYVAYYVCFASAWWHYLFLPIHVLMGPIHGAIVNYFGHRLGYRNHDTNDHSRNTLWIDLVTLGELFQNNHHARPNSPSFASRRFELDPIWPAIRTMNFLRILQLSPPARTP